jgi:hypothetical protein
VKRIFAIVVVVAACKKSGEADKLPVPEPPVAAIDAAAPPDLEAAEADRAMEAMTQGAIDGSILMKFAPATLAGVTRSNRLEQVFAVAAAYELDNGTYANLDIKNTFRRGGVDLEDQLMRACKRTEKVGGHVACVIVKADRASFHWDLPDRLTVDLSAPDEKLLRKMAAELPLGEIAALSKAPTEPAGP